MIDTTTGEDARVTCITCHNRQRGGCIKPLAAGLTTHRRVGFVEVGRDLASLPQHCGAWREAVRRDARARLPVEAAA